MLRCPTYLDRRTLLRMYLHRPDVIALLDELFADAHRVDPPLLQPLHALAPAERTALMADYRRLYGGAAREAYLPLTPAAGALLYTLARARDARTIVEFGTSFGISTIYLAAALADAGGGRLVTTELEPSKAERARANLARAGLADLVEIRTGDALETLADAPRGIDLVYLDGAKTLYRPVLSLLEPRLAPRAVVVADNVDMGEVVAEFTAYIRDPANGYASNRVVPGPRGASEAEGLEVSVRAA
jgi:predicted O-methyltransferase YrrM